MSLKTGDRMPEVTLRTMGADGIEEVSTSEVFGGKKVVLFAVPGAFTPTCSDTHLPGFLLRAEDILARGVDRIACVAVNDPFVMEAWRKALNVGETLLMLADGNGDLARAMGLELDATAFGMGKRSRRYAAIVEDGVLRWLGVEPAGGVTVSGADAVLEAL